jgi:hypothetical protein
MYDGVPMQLRVRVRFDTPFEDGVVFADHPRALQGCCHLSKRFESGSAKEQLEKHRWNVTSFLSSPTP